MRKSSTVSVCARQKKVMVWSSCTALGVRYVSQLCAVRSAHIELDFSRCSSTSRRRRSSAPSIVCHARSMLLIGGGSEVVGGEWHEEEAGEEAVSHPKESW